MMYTCKMCGVLLEEKAGQSVEKCPYCGMANIVARPKNVWQENLLDKADYYRRNRDFSKADALYEKILEKDNEQMAAHWGKALCKYGVEYISDLATGNFVPACHRMRSASIFEDEDYQIAVYQGQEEEKELLEREAGRIEEIQQKHRKEAEGETGYDIVLCCREQFLDGRRTKDSQFAEELYQYLKKNGFDVFYERECKKQHSDTTAYRCAALASATVMIVIGINKASFEEPLVKNQWLSFLKQNSPEKLLVAYKDMDCHELPDEILHLQAKNMNRLSFLQELLEELHQLCDSRLERESDTEEEEANENSNINAESLTERAFLCLEDREFEKADELLEKALNSKARYAKAYVGKLMVKLGVNVEEALAYSKTPLEQYKEYNRILRFGDADLRLKIENYNKQIIERNTSEELSAKEKRYNTAQTMMETATTEQAYLDAARAYNDLNGYKDSRKKYTYCMQTAAKENKYQNADRLLHNSSYDEAEVMFIQLGDYKDSQEKAKNCQNEKIYQNGLSLLSSRKYDKAAEVFTSLGDYKNSAEQVVRCQERVDRETLEAQKNEKKEELQRQKENIKREIREMGVFDGKKTRELYGKLDEVEDLIRELNDEQIFMVAEEEPEEQEEEKPASQKDALLIKKEKIKYEIEKQGIFDGKRRKELFSQLDDIEDRIRELNESQNGFGVPAKASEEEPAKPESKEEPKEEIAATVATDMDKQELIEELRRRKESIKDEIEQQGIFAGKRIKQLYGELDKVEDQIKDIHVELSPFMEKAEEPDIFHRPIEELNKEELRQRKEKVKKELEELGGVFDGKYRKELFAELDEIEDRLKVFLEQ